MEEVVAQFELNPEEKKNKEVAAVTGGKEAGR